jgi:hypothetical protein
LIGPNSAKSEIMSAFIGLFLHAIGGLAAVNNPTALKWISSGSGAQSRGRYDVLAGRLDPARDHSNGTALRMRGHTNL